MARATPGLRGTIYDQIGESAGVTLGIALTVLAILLALPDRPAIKDIRGSDTWPLLQGLLLAIALLALVAMTSARIGSATDRGQAGCEWLEQLMLAAAATAVAAMLVAGITFALILSHANRPDDPSRGRGAGGQRGA
jgi:hypothetical protein